VSDNKYYIQFIDGVLSMLKKVLLMTSVCVASITAQSQASRGIAPDQYDQMKAIARGLVVPPQPVQNVAPVQPVQNNPNNNLQVQQLTQRLNQELANLQAAENARIALQAQLDQRPQQQDLDNLNAQLNQRLADLANMENVRQAAEGERDVLRLLVGNGMGLLQAVPGNDLLARIATLQQQLADAQRERDARPAQDAFDALQRELEVETDRAGERLQLINDGMDRLQAFAVPDDDLLARINAQQNEYNALQQVLDERTAELAELIVLWDALLF
jgi:hypothetical protein